MPSGTLEQLVLNVAFYILNPLISILFGAALIVFIWGIFEYFWHRDSEESRSKGQKHMLWGLVGMFFMFSAYAIVAIIGDTIGTDVPFEDFQPTR